MIVYGDYECPFCAALDLRLASAPVRVAFRHFPVRSAHPRAHAGRPDDALWARITAT